MEVRNCKGCNRLFQYIGGQVLCPSCREELENRFQEVKEYIYSHKGASITQVSEDTGVSPKQIKQWIREDRLVLSEASADGITCEKCGIPIRSGRFCDQCKNKMVNEFSGAAGHPKGSLVEKKVDKTGTKMRFLS